MKWVPSSVAKPNNYETQPSCLKDRLIRVSFFRPLPAIAAHTNWIILVVQI
jgi:hypothetical protein